MVGAGAVAHDGKPGTTVGDRTLQFRAAQKKDSAIADIPVVVVTAFGSSVTKQIDAQLILHKPLDLDRLLTVIRDYC